MMKKTICMLLVLISLLSTSFCFGFKKQAGKVTLTQSRNGYFPLAKTQKIRAIYKAPISSPKKRPFADFFSARGLSFRSMFCYMIINKYY